MMVFSMLWVQVQMKFLHRNKIMCRGVDVILTLADTGLVLKAVQIISNHACHNSYHDFDHLYES